MVLSLNPLGGTRILLASLLDGVRILLVNLLDGARCLLLSQSLNPRVGIRSLLLLSSLSCRWSHDPRQCPSYIDGGLS